MSNVSHLDARPIGDVAAEVVNDLADRTSRPQPMVDHYRWWRNAAAGRPGLVHDGDPQCGFYRRKRRGGGCDPAAIFMSEGQIVCVIGPTKSARTVDAAAEWSWLYPHPISEAEYDRVARQGLNWSDMDETVAASIAAPRSGSNEPADEIDILKDQIDSASAAIADYAQITDDEMSARAQSLRSRLLELSRTADKKREALKKPHLEAGKTVDATWQPIVRAAKDAADAVQKAMSAWETRKAQAYAQEQQRIREEQRRQEEAARAAAAAGQPAPEPVAPPHARQPAPAPATTVKGAYGRAASVKVVRVATVTDQDAAYGFLRAHPELVELIAKLAQRAIDKGHDVPGVAIEEQRKVA